MIRRLLILYIAINVPLNFGLIVLLLSIYFGVIIWSLPLIAFIILDIKSRLVEYRSIRKYVRKGKSPEYLIKYFTKSRCQRDALYAATIGSSYQIKVKKLFADLGYRWYHILPDWTYSNPLYIFNKNFWKTFFK